MAKIFSISNCSFIRKYKRHFYHCNYYQINDKTIAIEKKIYDNVTSDENKRFDITRHTRLHTQLNLEIETVL